MRRPNRAQRASCHGALRRSMRRFSFLHLHRYTWYAEDPFSGHNLYACRCGRIRPGL